MPDTFPKALSLESQLCYSLYGASMAMTRVYKPLLDRLGITYPQYLVLHVLWEDNHGTIGTIAERLSLESSTITPLVQRLEAAGHVTRTRDLDDERIVRVNLTERGSAMRSESDCIAQHVFERTGLSAVQVQQLTDQIQVLRQALSDNEGAA